MSLIKAIQRAFAKIAPTCLAEPWDNTGLIIEAPYARSAAPRVLLTIDLSTCVLKEALSPNSGVGAIVAYHPPIFRGLKSLTMADPLQSALLKCAMAGVSVYCPHTALDSVVGGINDELARIVAGGAEGCIVESITGETVEGAALKGRGVGGGRLARLTEEGLDIPKLVARIKSGLGLPYVQLARSSSGTSTIKTVGLCAGSGSSVLSSLNYACDAFLTGEMDHHELLAATARGTHVILTSHSNTERFFLGKVLKGKLEEALRAEAANAELVEGEADPDEWRVVVSAADKDPIEIL